MSSGTLGGGGDFHVSVVIEASDSLYIYCLLCVMTYDISKTVALFFTFGQERVFTFNLIDLTTFSVFLFFIP